MNAVPTLAPEEYARRLGRTMHLVWVCVDCYFEHHGLLEDDAEPDREPLCLLNGVHVAAGGACEDSRHEDCDCDRREFSWSPCEGCGSTLGGAREALTIWEH